MTKSEGPTVIGLASLKGGVGKTTSAVHLAGAYTAAKISTLLVDGDRIRTATSWSRSGHLPFPVLPATALAKAGDYEVVIIDSRGGPDPSELVELAQSCDLLLLPTPADLSGMDGISQTVEILEGAGIPSRRYAALLTRVRPGKRGVEARESLAALGVPTLRKQVRESTAFHDAVNMGVLVNAVKTNRAALACWHDYVDVATEAAGRIIQK